MRCDRSPPSRKVTTITATLDTSPALEGGRLPHGRINPRSSIPFFVVHALPLGNPIVRGVYPTVV